MELSAGGRVVTETMASSIALGELQALVFKAARGAGRAYGVAEDAGRAARWLAGHGQDGAGALARLLQGTDGVAHGALAPSLPDLLPEGKLICPLILGAYLADAGIVPEGPLGPVLEPLVLIPFLADLAQDGAIRLVMGGDMVTVQTHAMEGAPGLRGPSMLRLERIDRLTLPRADTDAAPRTDLSPDAAAILTDLAARTFAPATDASRTRGAGAGLSDTD